MLTIISLSVGLQFAKITKFKKNKANKIKLLLDLRVIAVELQMKA